MKGLISRPMSIFRMHHGLIDTLELRDYDYLFCPKCLGRIPEA
jgi:hypothetical protein